MSVPESYKPCVEDGTAHVHEDGKLVLGSVFLCSMCRPTNEELEIEAAKYAAYEKREARKYATRRPSKSFRLALYRNRIKIIVLLLMGALLFVRLYMR
jgi:hypothetical protein